MTSANTQLSDSLYIVAIATGLYLYICLAVLLATGTGVGFFTKHRTQRQRYIMLALGQATVVCALMYALSFGTTHEYWLTLREWWAAGLLEKAVAALAAVAMFSPMVTYLCWVFAYTHPATFAKSAGNGRMHTTDEWRNRRKSAPRSVMPEFYDPSKPLR